MSADLLVTLGLVALLVACSIGATFTLGQIFGFRQGCNLWRPFAQRALDEMPMVRRAALSDAIATVRELRTNLPGHSYDLALTQAEESLRRLMEDAQ